jgi:hypothetical protein
VRKYFHLPVSGAADATSAAAGVGMARRTNPHCIQTLEINSWKRRPLDAEPSPSRRKIDRDVTPLKQRLPETSAIET